MNIVGFLDSAGHFARGEKVLLAQLQHPAHAQQRRWLKMKLYALPGSPVLLFLYRYLFRFGFLDGVPGMIYCGFQAVQMFHTKAKIYELKQAPRRQK